MSQAQTPDRRKDRVGARVRFVNYVDRYPHAQIQPGETGTVATVEEHVITVKMDRLHEGLAEWENEVVFETDADNRDEFFHSTFLLEPPAIMATTTKETTYRDILDALQQAEEIGGVKDYADYAAMVTALMRECRTRLQNMTENLPACHCHPLVGETCDSCEAKQIVDEAGLL